MWKVKNAWINSIVYNVQTLYIWSFRVLITSYLIILTMSYIKYFWIYGNISAVGQLESEYADSTIYIFHEEKNLDTFRFID